MRSNRQKVKRPKEIQKSWLVWNEHHPDDKITEDGDYCIHHINKNHFDNRIENLLN